MLKRGILHTSLAAWGTFHAVEWCTTLVCNVQIEKQYGLVAMHSASARNRSLMPRMHTSTPQAIPHTHLIPHHRPQHRPQAEKHEKMWIIWVLILLEVGNCTLIAGIQCSFQGNFKHLWFFWSYFFSGRNSVGAYISVFFHVNHFLKS